MSKNPRLNQPVPDASDAADPGGDEDKTQLVSPVIRAMRLLRFIAEGAPPPT